MNPTPAPLDNAEHAASEALAPEWLSPLLRRRGVSGTVHSGGRVVREWDRFGWLEWARQADLMRLDPRVQMAWQARASELRAADWTVTPADHPDGERYAEHVRKALGLDGEPGMMRRTWGQFIDEAAWFAYYGGLPFEVVLRYDIVTGWVVPLDLEARIPSSIERWGEGDHLGPLEQYQRGAGPKPEPIPGDRLLMFTRGQIGTDWTGNGLARSAWAAWYRRNRLVDLRTLALARLGVLAPEVSYDPEALRAMFAPQAMREGGSGDPSSLVTGAVDRAVDNITAADAGERVTLVSIKDALEFRWNTGEKFDPAPLIATDERETQEIYAAFGVEFLAMGMGGASSGNRSLGEVHASLLRRMTIEDADAMQSAINGQWRDGGGLVGMLCQLNMHDFDPAALPTVEHQGLAPDTFAESLGAMAGLAAAGILTPDDGLESMARSAMGAPPLEDADRRSALERRAAGGDPGARLMARYAAARGRHG